MAGTPIESLDASVYTVPTDAPEADGTLSWDSITMVLVQARAGSECGTGWTYGSPACAAVVAGKLAGIVRGRDPLDTGGAFEAMVRAVRNDGRPGAVGYAISAVDVALWDLKAKLLGLSLTRLLGAVRAEVPVYGSGGFTSYSDRQLRDQLSGWVHEQRIPRAKIKVGESWGAAAGRDIARIGQAREVIGEQAELYIDANGGYTQPCAPGRC
jgi:L-alanine-DL-glutamate epimerase-like enolase superfamily enzyme